MLERTIISDGASKTWAMTGWRIGFVANRTLAPVFTRWITNTDSCASQISQWAAVEAINGPQDAADAMRARFSSVAILSSGCSTRLPGFSCKTPGGAFYAWPNVTEACKRSGCADSEEFRKRLLNEAGVAVLADIHFGRRVPGRRPAHSLFVRRVAGGDSHRRRAHRRIHARRSAGDEPARDRILGRVRDALGKARQRSEPSCARPRRISLRTRAGPAPAYARDRSRAS